MLKIVVPIALLVGGAYATGAFDAGTPSRVERQEPAATTSSDAATRSISLSEFGLRMTQAERELKSLDRCMDIIEEFGKRPISHVRPQVPLTETLAKIKNEDHHPTALDAELEKSGCPKSRNRKVREIFSRSPN